MALRGIHHINMDAKGRMALPAKMRAHLSVDDVELTNMVCTIDVQSRCLLMYPEKAWESVEEQLEMLPALDPVSRRLQRMILGHASDLELDSNGRVLLPSVLREYASLEKKIVVVGQAKRIEIWNEDAWLAERDLSLKDMAIGENELSEALLSLSL